MTFSTGSRALSSYWQSENGGRTVVDKPETVGAGARITVYAEDCVVSASIDLGQARLSDLLNDRVDHQLTDVEVTSLEDGHRVELPELVIAGDDILAVDATGPRGNPEKRRRTRQHPIVAKVGPYVVRGYFHALPGADPLASFGRRAPFVALTDAWLEFSIVDQVLRPYSGTLLVNRDAADWIDTAADDEVAPPDIPVESSDAPLVKDFTYQVLVSSVTGLEDELDKGPT
jgi:hypothetical protein